MNPSDQAVRRRGRVPLAVWIVLGVAAGHALFFWVVAHRHFLPKTRYVPPPPTPNFGARETTSVDPRTGETTIRRDFVVSTKLATPVPSPAPKR